MTRRSSIWPTTRVSVGPLLEAAHVEQAGRVDLPASMLVTRVIGTKIRRRPNTSATSPSTRGWLTSERIATTRSRTLPTWSPWGSKIGSPTSRAA